MWPSVRVRLLRADFFVNLMVARGSLESAVGEPIEGPRRAMREDAHQPNCGPQPAEIGRAGSRRPLGRLLRSHTHGVLGCKNTVRNQVYRL